MRRTSLLFSSFVGLSLAFSGKAWAQTQPTQTNLPSSQTTVEAIVLRIDDRAAPFLQLHHNLFATLKTETGQIFSMHVGPSWYLTSHNFDLKPGDVVQVTGEPMVDLINHPIINAMTIKKGNTVLALHNAVGQHVWYSQQLPQR
jgi:hypothetical protein